METQVKKAVTAEQVIKNFPAKGINLSEEEAEQYLDMLYFFSEQVVTVHNARKPCNVIQFKASNQRIGKYKL